MKLLIIGGTRFLGRALVEEGVAMGHKITLFNRGQSNPGLFPDVAEIHGDRDGGLDVLVGKKWDAVIDTCGYVPRLTRASAEALKDAVKHYTFISTISVYGDLSIVNMDESAPLGTMEDESVEEITGETYGPLKVLCEQSINEVMGKDRALHVRAGLIVGPHDMSDRFTYWPHRVAKGGDMITPCTPEGETQFIDVRDLANWAIRATEAKQSGAFNATGPATPLTMGELIASCQKASVNPANPIWVTDEFLQENEVGSFVEMPLWIPNVPDYAGFNNVSSQRAIEAGLTYRPLNETVADTLAWVKERPSDYEWRGGLKPEKEAELLQKWASQSE